MRKLLSNDLIYKSTFKNIGIFILLIIGMIICSLLSPSFLKTGNLFNIVKQLAPVIIIAIGECYLILSGHIDLSPGTVVAMTGVVATLVNNATGSVAVAVVSVIGLGAVVGMINGFFVTRYKLPAFIVTLGTQMISGGLALYLSQGGTIKVSGDRFKVFSQGSILGLPNLLVLIVILFLVFWFILNRTTYGRYLYAMGGNEQAAKASGINVNRIRFFTYTLTGALSGFAGFVLASRLNSGSPNVGSGYEFDAIIGVVLGGASLNGGVGTMFGTLIGCLIIGILNNALNLLNVSPYLQNVAKGILILIAVTIDAKSKGNSGRPVVMPAIKRLLGKS